MDGLDKSRDSWNIRRIVVADFIGAAIALYFRIFDFWSLGYFGTPRAFLDLAGAIVLPAVVLTVLLFWLVSACIALCRRKFRRAVGGVLAILTVPACFAIFFTIPLSDPWVWYVVINKSSLEATAANRLSPANPDFVILEQRDVSTGIAGLSPNHFVFLIYSERSLEELASSIPGLSHIHDHFYRRDEFM